MGRVCRAWFTHLQADLQAILIDNVSKPITSERMIAFKAFAIHIPQLASAYTRILLPDFFDVGHGKLLTCNPLKKTVLVILVISLLREVKQLAETLYLITARVFCMQVLYCLAPAFFRMEMLNCFSATLINSLKASARSDS